MAEWRVLRHWPSSALKTRLDALTAKTVNFDAEEQEMTGDRGWHHYHSEAVIAREPDGDERFARARTAVTNYQFSNPRIVVAHFDPAALLLARRILLEIQVLGLRYLCPAVVNKVRDEPGAYGFRYDTLEGHIERGVEWFLLTKDERGDIRFRIEARWQRGELPNWWSRIGFILLAGRYQRRWHRQAHQRMSLLAHYGSTRRPPRDTAGLTHQGVEVTFTYHTQRKHIPMTTALTDTLTLGALTGMRSMSGPLALALRRGGVSEGIFGLMAAGEMVADKTSLVGDRTDAFPLAGRALVGAVVGAMISREQGSSVIAGVALGAGAAVVAAHLAFRLRKRLPVSSTVGGMLEDALALGLAASYASRRRRSSR